MKKIFSLLLITSLKVSAIVFLIIFIIGNSGCVKDPHFPIHNYNQVNLVSDVPGYGAAKIDANLGNAWGIAAAPSGPIWISANHTGLSTVYDKNGNTLIPPVLIPGHEAHLPGAPTGVVFNATTDFVIPSSNLVSKFIFAGEDGTILAWAGGSSATLVADRSLEEAVYKGLALGNDQGHNFIYVTNFKQAKIDVFDQNFHYVTNKPFYDPAIPQHFAPFNIRNIDGKLFVTYAKQKGPDNEDDEAGAGNGFVDVYNTDGSLLFRFASQGTLNSPWGIVQSRSEFMNIPNAILIGNFGDGRINVYDAIGRFQGQLMNGGSPIVIEGLWALENNIPLAMANQLYFTAGPADEEHGLFGYLQKN